MSLKGFLIEHIELLMKEANSKALDSLLSFWNDKINGKNFSAFQNIQSIISESEKLIKILQEFKDKKGNTTITVKEDYYDPSNMNFDLVRKSLPPHYFKSKNKSINILTDSYKVTSPIIAMEEEKEIEEEEEDESPNQRKQKNTFFNSRLKSSTNVLVYELDANPNEDEDEDDDDDDEIKSIARNDKKSKTVGGIENNLNSLNFTYQEEEENINFIIKKKKFTNFISFIDIDLFLQYLALDKNFFENKEDDKLLVEGFCLQYQSFILAKTIIGKIISCFDHFYLGLSNEIDKKDNEVNPENNQRKKIAYSKRKISESSVKIPYGVIDLLCTFITIHNIYYHNELSSDLINKISEFLKRLSDISEIKEKFGEKLETAEIELKEYEVSIKTIDSNPDDANEFTSDDIYNLRLDKEKNENEEKDGKKQNARVNLPKAGTFNSSSFKLNILEPKNKANFLNIYADQKQKGEEKLYEFDMMKYKIEDIAFELTRVNYSLYSRIKIKEFLKGVFNGKDKYKLSPYICRIIKRFNSLSAWVIEEILAYDHAEKRSQILLRFIKICVILQKIGNFDDCLSIMTGLTNSNINKLQKTWGHIRSVDQKEFLGLKKLLSFEDNWRNLRNEVEKQIIEKRFFIPYLGYYTKRITSLEESPYVQKNTSLINIEKILEIYKVLKEFYTLRQVKNKYHCADENIRKELYLLQCLEPSNEDILSQTANLLEPKFVLSNKKMNEKRRTKTDMNFYNNINKNKNDII